MIKFIGAFIFVIGGFFLGNSINKYYLKKVENYRDIISFFTFCRSEITHNGTEIDSICKNYVERKDCSDSIVNVVKKHAKETEEEIFIDSFIKETQNVDYETSQKVYEIYLKDGQQRLNNSKQEQEKKGKMAMRLLPVLCIGVAVLLW